MLIFFRKVPDMGLNGTLGYNMNLLTELSELLVESSPAYSLCPQKNATLASRGVKQFQIWPNLYKNLLIFIYLSIKVYYMINLMIFIF